MEYHIRIYAGETMQDIMLADRDKVTIGSGKNDDCYLSFPEILEEHVSIYKRNGVWFVSGKNISELAEEKEIKDGDVYVLNQKQKIAVYVYGKDAYVGGIYDLGEENRFIIGRAAQCNIVLPGNNISRKHAVIERQENAFLLTDNNSLNGTYLNHKKISEAQYLSDGDVITIGDYHIKYSEGKLRVNHRSEEEEDKKKVVDYPHYFKIAPRMQRELPVESITVQNPPQEITKPESNMAGSVVSPLIMVIIMVIMAALSFISPVMLIFTVPMSIITVVMAVRNKKKAEKKAAQKEAQRVEKYGAYLEETEKHIQELKQKQVMALQLASPSPEECVKIVKERSIRLWTRRIGDEDFLKLRIGKGDTESSFRVKGSWSEFTMDEDKMLTKAQELVSDAQMVKSVPIECDVRRNCLVGIIGERKGAVSTAKNMLVQAAVHHSYEELKIVTVYSQREAKDWEWIRWLPHSFDESRSSRYMAKTRSGADNVLKSLEEMFKQRSMADERDEVFFPHFLFVFTEMELVENHPLLKYLIQNERNLGVSILFLFDEMRHLPKECNTIIETADSRGVIYNKQNTDIKTEFNFDSMGAADYDTFARQMAPVRVMGSASETSLPSCITFLQGYNVKRPEEFHVEYRWGSSFANESMAVPVGVKTNGEPFMFDIHEKKYGPHGLVAGMTGSGKSEMVQTWILSMALKFSPEDVSFVLIDFKGTGLILPFLNLPHLAGTISDLDHKIQRNLVALENELSRRKELLDSYGVNNINSYLKLFHAGKAKESLSFLFVIIDEFAEFKVQFPEFMTVVDRIFAIGRTLGVFAILLTQKPAGVVDDKMNANTRFRWCLKVASSADSKEMLHHADAAQITVPGRAYVQVGEDEVYELIQSYYSGAAYNPDSDEQASDAWRVAMVDERGTRTYYENEERRQALGGDTSEITEIVRYLHDYVQKSERNAARKIWMPKMDSVIYLDDLRVAAYKDGSWQEADNNHISVIVGMVDNPAMQKQYPLSFDFTQDGHVAVYGAPGTGKTTLLQTAVMSLIQTYSPEQVNIYIMDFGGWSMGIFKDFPHVGGIANDNDDIKIEKLTQLLERKLTERKEKFSDIGVGSLQAYMQATGEVLPAIILVLDNFAPVLQLYPQLDTFFIRLTREGGNYGIYFLVTANSTMALSFKIQQNIKMAVALQMTERADYAGIVGKTGGLEPENFEGRGLVKGNPPLEFQAALPAFGRIESERVTNIKNSARKMNEQYSGACAPPIPVMPEEIPYGSIHGFGVVVGLSVKLVEPVSLPEKRQHYFPIVGIRGAGKSNMLSVIAEQLIHQENARIAYVDLMHSQSEWEERENCDYLFSAEMLDDYMEGLIPTLGDRKEKHDADAFAEFDPIYLFIDDYSKVYAGITQKTATRLESVIRLGEGLNVHLFVADDGDSFSRLCNQGEAVTMLMSRENTGLILGGSMNSYPAFNADMASMEKNQPVGEWEGYLLVKGKPVKMKAMRYIK